MRPLAPYLPPHSPGGRQSARLPVRLLLLLALIAALILTPQAASAADAGFVWSQFGYDEQHSGVNPLETTITTANVHSLKRLYRVPLVDATKPSTADGEPAFLGGANANGVRDMLFLTTKDGWVLALDAATGRQIWARQHGPNGCLIQHDTQRNETCFTTSSPAIDPNRQYVYAYGLDGYVHKYAVTSGVETQDVHWPELVSLKPWHEKITSPLTTAIDRNGHAFLYVATSGNLGDEGDYQGHLTTIDLASGLQHVFNALCSDATAGSNIDDVHFADAPGTPDCPQTQSAIWGRAGVIHDPINDRIYFATGNGAFDPAMHYWGDSVLALNPDGTGTGGNPIDSYTPTDQADLHSTDSDLGSTSPALLPPLSGSRYPHLAVMGQKIVRATGAADLRLINRDNLSLDAAPGPGHTGGEVGARFPLPQGGFLMTQPTVWTDTTQPGRPWVYVASEGGIVGLQVYADGGSDIPAFHLGWSPVSRGRTCPIVANGVLYFFGLDGMQALDPRTGVQLWADTSVFRSHWESPIVADGALYITDESGFLTAYRLKSGGTPTLKVTAKRLGKRVTFRWTVSSVKGVKGFRLYDGQRQLTGSLIRVHADRVYHRTARWPAKKQPAPFALQVIMKDRTQFTVAVQ